MNDTLTKNLDEVKHLLTHCTKRAAFNPSIFHDLSPCEYLNNPDQQPHRPKFVETLHTTSRKLSLDLLFGMINTRLVSINLFASKCQIRFVITLSK